ncbi:hypothetical protein PENTCL1PPCAC_24158 [Pristionchus entomophagus]|uniref:GB1/RHD3-type G domain-containing protein n=1 Tax=Pristionchus entomophagus TaxID=358040 RepID=A0AAV5U562_9BILA|nr:hypothetical protein PENTCL1PPCAC_24158 [Pristionchus entomophagus]
MSHPSAVQIVEKVGGRFVLKEDALIRILEQKNVMDRKVAIIAVAGAFRKGKSFFLSNVVRYLECRATMSYTMLSDGRYWMAPDAPVTGFSYRRSTHAVTEGILMWPEPFVVKKMNGEEVAILLMDTEGAFDHNSSFNQCATVFSLSAHLSSLLVYNVMQDIQEDTLSHLQFFAQYGSYALGKDINNSPFQSLMFLVRDWQNSDEYGMNAGRELLDELLKPTASCNNSMLALRKDIQRSFAEIKCFLLSGPGNKICRGSEGEITVNDMDPEFKAGLIELIFSMIENHLNPKKIGGKEITGTEFLYFFKTYFSIFASGRVPEPKSLYHATSEATHMTAASTCLGYYNTEMNKYFSQLAGQYQYFEPSQLQSIHQDVSSAALRLFYDIKKMGSLPEYFIMLTENIEMLFKSYYQKENGNRITERLAKLRKEETEQRRIVEEERSKRELAEMERQREELRLKMEREKREKEEAERRKMEEERRHKEEVMKRENAERIRLEEEKRARVEREKQNREQLERDNQAREVAEQLRQEMEKLKLENERQERARKAQRENEEREEERREQRERERRRRQEEKEERDARDEARHRNYQDQVRHHMQWF